MVQHIRKYTPSYAVLGGMVLVLVFLTAFGTLIQTPKYRSQTKLLLKQQYGPGFDPYNITKATEYYSNLFSEVVFSQEFFNDVMAQDPRIQQNFFPTSAEQRTMLWRKTVSASPTGDTGILTITVYHPLRGQAEALSAAIANVLTSKGADFHGVGDRLQIQTIDGPVTSEKPVSPVLWLNTVVALLLGSMLAVGWKLFASTSGHTHTMVHEEEYFLK